MAAWLRLMFQKRFRERVPRRFFLHRVTSRKRK
jgi:hypothetical protein